MTPVQGHSIDAQIMYSAHHQIGGEMGAQVGEIMGGLVAGPTDPSAVLGQVKELLQNLAEGLQGLLGQQAPSRPQAFSPSCVSPDALQNPMGVLRENNTTNINININIGGADAGLQAGPVHYGKAPMVGNDSQWPGFSDAVKGRMTGSESAKNALFDGTNPWAKNDDKTVERTAVGWAMQQDDRLRYDTDRKQLYITNTDGSTRDVASIGEVMEKIAANGGANQNNGKGFQAVGGFLQNRVAEADATGGAGAGRGATGADDIGQLLKQLFEKLNEMMQRQAQVMGRSMQLIR